MQFLQSVQNLQKGVAVLLLGIILAVISGVTVIALALKKALDACSSAVVAWKNLVRTIKK